MARQRPSRTARRPRTTYADRPAAYVKPVSEEGETVYAVFSEDGRLLGIAPTRALAIWGARRHAFVPVDAH